MQYLFCTINEIEKLEAYDGDEGVWCDGAVWYDVDGSYAGFYTSPSYVISAT